MPKGNVSFSHTLLGLVSAIFYYCLIYLPKNLQTEQKTKDQN